MANTITIPAPRFEKGALVWLHFSKGNIPTSIVGRRYHLDHSAWAYQVAISPKIWFLGRNLDYRFLQGGE